MNTQDLYTIEDGKVLLKKTKWFNQRELAIIDNETQETVLAALHQNFKELLKEWADFLKLFEEETEITRLAGKLSRKKNYFSKAKAIGDYDSLFTSIEDIESKIETRVNEVVAQKKALCDKLAAIQNPENWKEVTAQLTEIRKEFGDLPQVPHPEDESYKKRLEELINDFFIEKSQHHKEFEQELMVNLAKKIELCERAEGIKESEDWRKTSDTYAQLLELWKNVGPVPRHKSEELWMRYNAAKDYFYERKQKFYDDLIEQLENNLREKEALVSQAEALKDSTDWKETTSKMNDLMEAWKKIGNVGKENSDDIWNRFNEARNNFFSNKKNHFAGKKIELENNLAKKIAIAQRAEELKDTTDFEAGTAEFHELMDAWKAIGYADRKLANEQWEIFIKARKYFFERKDAARDAERGDVLETINRRIGKNIGLLNKLEKELRIENEVLQDAEHRLNNIAPSVNAFESQERYERILEEAKVKVGEVQKRIDDIQSRIDADKKERGRLYYEQKKAEERNPELKKERLEKEAKQKENRKTKEADYQNNRSHKKRPIEHKETLLGAQLKGLNFDGLDD